MTANQMDEQLDDESCVPNEPYSSIYVSSNEGMPKSQILTYTPEIPQIITLLSR